MTFPCPRGWVVSLVAGAVTLAACRASVPGPASVAPAPAPARAKAVFTVARYAESVPITALAVAAPYVWAGTAHGLRRWRVAGNAAGKRDANAGAGASADSDADAEAIGSDTGLPGHRIDALGVDDDRGVWVATEAGIGRFTEKSGHPRYEPRGKCAATITLLAPTSANAGAWAGGEAGLFRYDGRAWTALDFLRGVAVTSLELDDDGRSVWVGTRGRGLFRADAAGGGTPILAPGDGAATEEVVGTARSAGGARLVATRVGLNGDGNQAGRLTQITKDGTEEYRTQSGAGVHFVRLFAAGVRPILLAGGSPAGGERLYELRPLPRGESPAAGAFRLVSARKGSTARYQALPMALAVPPEITVVASGGGSSGTIGAGADADDNTPPIWFGARVMGVARAQPARPRYLSGDLTEDADRLSVVCTATDSCLVVAGGAHAWFFDGAGFRETRVGEGAQGRALAVVTDRAGTIFGVVTEPPFRSILIARLASTSVGDPRASDWQVIEKVPVSASASAPATAKGAEGSRPSVSFAAFAPDGKLWLGVGEVAPDGQEQGRGALEISLGLPASPSGPLRKGTIVHHGGAVSGKLASAEALPLPHDLTGVIFDGAATWFSSRSGIDRLQQSELRHWGENEHMNSEVCFGVAKGTDGKIWAATSGGVGRFDGTDWRFAGDGEAAASATRAVVNDGGGRMWLATSRGLRVLDEAAAGAPGSSVGRIGDGELIVEDDMLALTVDWFGRVWALGDAALAIVGTSGGTR